MFHLFSLSLSLSLSLSPLLPPSLPPSLPLPPSLFLFLSLPSLSPTNTGFNEYRADPNVIGSGDHTLSVKCYHQPESLSVTEKYKFNLKPAPKIRK